MKNLTTYQSANVLYAISTYLIFHEYQFSDNDDKRMNICISAHSCTFWYLLVRTAYKSVHNFRYVQLAQAALAARQRTVLLKAYSSAIFPK